MKKFTFIIFAFFLFFFSGRTTLAWFEYPVNPIYDPIVTAEKAYYPSVLKMGNNDYRMWYQTNSTSSSTTVAYATSIDGKSWTLVTNNVTGLIPDNSGHPHVEFADNKFRIWYWNAATPYGNNAMHYAESVDGITWTNDSPITGNLTTTASGQWNSGIYGVADVIINENSTNVGTNPFDYKYAMYYDATSGGYEQIALGYSADGINWTLYGTEPVLLKGQAGSWDSGYAAIGSTVLKDNTWTMWYSGGVSTSNEGIGCATSINGLEWTKCATNPIMHKNDGVTWRNNRTYTPSVIRDGGIDKMWFTGKDNATGNYAICYATLGAPGNVILQETSNGGVSLPNGTSDIVLDDATALNISNSANTVSDGIVIIGGVSKILSNFTSGDLTGVDLSMPETIGGQSITIGKAVKISSGLSGVPIAITNSVVSNTHVSIPDNTTILAPSDWDGTISPPKTGLSGDIALSGYVVGDTVIDIGSPNAVLLFDKPVVVIINGVTGDVGYKPAGSTIWNKITNVCGGDYNAPTLSAAAFPGECSITNGIDTKILTYHFTTFGGLAAIGESVVLPDNFSVLAGSTITNTGSSTINGDIGLSPGSEITGFPLGIINGTQYIADAVAIQAKTNLATAYNNAAGKTPVSTVATELGGTTKTAGVYNSADGTFGITGTLTLDAQGDPNAVFIFKTASTLITAGGSNIVLANGAQACNVFWRVGSSATLGTNSTFKGTIMALTSITVTTGANVNGSLLARNGAVTLDTNIVTMATCAITRSSSLHPATINVVKIVINDNGGTKTIADFPLFVNGTLVVSGVANVFPAPQSMYHVTETVDPNYTRTFSGDCDANGDLNIFPGNNKVCIITNNDIGPDLAVPPVPPLIDVVKVPSPLSLPDGPGAVTYTYILRNIGTESVSDVTMVDDTCNSIILASGDTNNDNKLDINETWKYTCSANLSETHTNTVVATGWANGISATDIADATVIVGQPILSPLIHVTKTANPLKLLAKGGMVTYTYKVTNPGIVALSNINLTDDKCGPVKYVTGDINHNYKIEPTETFTYTCQTKLTETTVNTVVAVAEVNGILVRDFALVTVVVAAPTSVFGQQVKAITVNLREGNLNNNVVILQNFLITQNKGLAAKALAKVGATSYFGVLTRAALAEFQARAGIKPALGYFGPITRAYLSKHY